MAEIENETHRYEIGSGSMNLHECFAVQNACYQAGRHIKPRGIMVHSTGANNPNLRRYVQPDDGKLGTNASGNHFNVPLPGGRQVCVHAFIGKLADGSIATYQTLPWTMRGWHAGGRANDTHIGFEICEDGLSDSTYFAAVYREAVELAAYLCEEFALTEQDVICHSEGYQRGIASNHSDVMHWFPKHGKSMNSFRADVKTLLAEKTIREEELTMTKEELLSVAGTGDTPSEWAREATEWAKEAGIVNGDGEGNYGWQQPITREALVTVLHNFKEYLGM